MAREFTRSGIRIYYPDEWKLEQEETDDGWSASILSPDTAFLMLSHHSSVDDPSELSDMALEAMRESYPELEVEHTVETIAGQPAVGHNVDFITLDLSNTCWIRSLQGPEGCILMMGQCTDQELATNGKSIQTIYSSLTIAEH